MEFQALTGNKIAPALYDRWGAIQLEGRVISEMHLLGGRM